MTVAFRIGWSTALFSTFLINDFDLFGLRQMWLYFREEEYRPITFCPGYTGRQSEFDDSGNLNEEAPSREPLKTPREGAS